MMSRCLWVMLAVQFSIGGGVFANDAAEPERAGQRKSESMFRYPKTFNNVISKGNNPPYKPAPLLSDEAFYGTWDEAGSKWTNPGLFNYAARPGLKPVEDAVKGGDYEAAGNALLAYYRMRNDVDLPDLRDANDPKTKLRAELFMDQVYFRHGQEPFDQFEVSSTFQEYGFDVTKYLREGRRSFLFMSRKKGAGAAIFNSREALNHRPELRLTIRGKERTLEPEADTTVQFAADPRGKEDTLVVRGSKPGVVVDQNTCKVLIRFNLQGISPDTIERAELIVYGKTANDTQKVPVILGLDYDAPLSADNEARFIWNNMTGNQFSYEGLSGLNAWRNPEKGNPHKYFFITGIVRFNPYPDIIAMYLKTQDERYARQAIQIYLDYIQFQMFNRLDDGSRASNLVRPSQALYKSPSMTPRALKIMIEHAWRVGNWYTRGKDWHSTHNFGSSYLSGCACLAYCFPELRDAATWWQITNERALFYTSKGIFGADHSFLEPNTSYACMVLSALNQYRTLALKSGVTLPPKLVENFRGIAWYAMDVSDPSGTVYPYGDTGGPHAFSKEMIKGVGVDHDAPGLVFVATNGKEGTRPTRHPSVWYPVSKLGIMRTAWADENALGLFVNAQGSGGSHWQPNNLSICAYAYGQQLIDDTYWYPEFNRLWPRQHTRDHNTVTINGQSQKARRNGADGGMVVNPLFDFFDGYSDLTPGFRHRRRILMVKPSKFWIVSDQLDARTNPDAIHTYEQTWHFRPSSRVAIDSTTGVSVTDYPNGSNMTIVPAAPREIKATLADGWWSNDRSEYVSYVKSAKGSTAFDTVLYPNPKGEPVDVTVARMTIEVPTTVATALDVKIKSKNLMRHARFYLSNEKKPARRNFGAFSTDAHMVYFEQDAAGEGQVLALEAGSLLRDENRVWVACSTPVSDLGVIWDAEKKSLLVTASDNTLPTTVKIYSPFSASHVLLNGEAMEFKQESSVVIVEEEK